MRLEKVFMLLPVAVAMIACELATATPVVPAIPTDAVQFTPGLRFKLWWSMVESCSGRQADFAAVRWYDSPGVTHLPDGAQGSYYPATNQIVIAGDFVKVGALVRHEMLHAMLPVGGHPHDPFVTSCFGIVGCDGPCATEAGRQVPTDAAPEVPVGDLSVDVSTVPATLSASTDSGVMAIIITATNHNSAAVWVRLSPDLASPSTYATWGYLLDLGTAAQSFGQGMGGGASRIGFAPLETQRWVWEVTADTAFRGLRGYFNGDTTVRHSISVSK